MDPPGCPICNCYTGWENQEPLPPGDGCRILAPSRFARFILPHLTPNDKTLKVERTWQGHPAGKGCYDCFIPPRESLPTGETGTMIRFIPDSSSEFAMFEALVDRVLTIGTDIPLTPDS